MIARVTQNPLADAASWPAAPATVAAYHRSLPGYAPTRLLDAPRLAARLGLGRVLIKAETSRMGLPSFKILGASWATYRAICDRLGAEPGPWKDIGELAARLAHLRPLKLVTATDGNHGRAVARMARWLGFDCDVFVPEGMAPARIRAIEGEGATVTVVGGDYDDAVARAARQTYEHCIIVSDTSWPGYEKIPSYVIEGYSTIFHEVDAAFEAHSWPAPDLVVVPVGVGAFMAAAVTHYRSGGRRPILVGVEPLDANCVQASTLAGTITQVPGPHRSIMVGLNCGWPSLVAWPRLASGTDWLVSVDNDAALTALRELADQGLATGETGCSSLAGLNALLADPAARTSLADLSGRTVLLVVTEAPTDPDYFEAVVGRSPEAVSRLQGGLALQ